MSEQIEIHTVIEKKALVSEETSKRILSLRYFLILMVVIVHCTLRDYKLSDSGIQFYENEFARWLKLFISESFSRGVVLLFFMFSSYFQYLKNDRYPVLLKKKVKSLLIPFLVWPLLNVVFYLIKGGLCFLIPSFHFYSIEVIFLSWTWKEWINAFLGYWGHNGGFPFLVQFWFLRDLMVLTFFSPVIKYFVKKNPREFLLLLFFIYLCKVKCVYMSEKALLFYSLGFFCAEYNVDFFGIADKIKWKILIPLFIFIWIFRWTLGISFDVSEQIMGLAACFIILKLSKIFAENERIYGAAKYLGGVSFFLYCAHYSFLLSEIQFLWLRNFPIVNTFWSLSEFFCVTLAVVVIGTGIGIFLRRFCNPVFAFLNGGRG